MVRLIKKSYDQVKKTNILLIERLKQAGLGGEFLGGWKKIIAALGFGAVPLALQGPI